MTPSDHSGIPEPRREREIGWYRDPHDSRVHRFWNGQDWSDFYPEHEVADAPPPDGVA